MASSCLDYITDPRNNQHLYYIFPLNTPKTEDFYLKTALNYNTLKYMLRAGVVTFSDHKNSLIKCRLMGTWMNPVQQNALWEPCGAVHLEPFGNVCIIVNMSASPQRCIGYLRHFENEDQNASWVMRQFTWRLEHSRTHKEWNGSDYAHLPPFSCLFLFRSHWQGVLVPQWARNK